MDELCPICIENPAEIITNCNHAFCICCLSRITKCAICRSPLQRVKLCIEIKTYTRNSGMEVPLIALAFQPLTLSINWDFEYST